MSMRKTTELMGLERDVEVVLKELRKVFKNQYANRDDVLYVRDDL